MRRTQTNLQVNSTHIYMTWKETPAKVTTIKHGTVIYWGYTTLKVHHLPTT